MVGFTKENINYKGYEITGFGNGYTVEFEGEEIYFTSVEEAKAFIESL